MKIAIIGTRGIPNNYGGFEQFAEKFSVKLVRKGHTVIVYNPSYHLYEKNDYFGVKIIKKYSPEKLVGPFANYIYDYLCLKDAIRRKCHIVLACGYTSSPMSYVLLKLKKTILVSNMDGLEWKRKRWNIFERKLILIGERLAVKKSDYLVADNLNIVRYIHEKFKKSTEYIPYATDILENVIFDKNVLDKYNLKKNEYYLMIARGVPENSFEEIIEGVLLSQSNEKLLIVSSLESKYLRKIREKYNKKKQIIFVGGIYNKNFLNTLRYYSKIYFHGHSVGGTNPSLLEAMAAKCMICAHDNIFNRSVLGEDGLYFMTRDDIKNQVQSLHKTAQFKNNFIVNNLNKIKMFYNWDNITNRYEKFFLKIIEQRNF